MVDAKGSLLAGLNTSEFGGSVFVVGKQDKGAEMHVTKYGGAVFVWGKEAKGGAAMHLDGFGGKVYTSLLKIACFQTSGGTCGWKPHLRWTWGFLSIK